MAIIPMYVRMYVHTIVAALPYVWMECGLWLPLCDLRLCYVVHVIEQCQSVLLPMGRMLTELRTYVHVGAHTNMYNVRSSF